MACSAAVPVPGYPQFSPTATTVAPEVVVTATRFSEPQQTLPVGVTVITRDDIRNSTAATVPELLRQYPGIQVRDSSGSPNWQIDMRGFGITGDQNTLVLLDGRRISENELATVNWAGIPLMAIERIEIMRGSGAVLYGGGATGGTINIITRAPQQNSRSAYAGAGAGSNHSADYRAGLNLAGKNLGLALHASHLETDNYRDHNRLRQHNAQADLRYSGERGTLYAKLGTDDQRLQLPNALSEAQIAVNPRQAAAPFGSYSDTSGGYLNLGGELELGDAQLAFNGGLRDKDASAALFFAVNTRVRAKHLTPRMKLPFAWGQTRHTLVAGIDWDEWDYDSTSPLGSPVSNQRNRALYAQHTAMLSPATVLSAGARLHRTEFGTRDTVSGSAASREDTLHAFEVAARQRLGDVVTVYGKFGSSFRVPNVNETYNLFTGTVTMLAPQISRDREIGAELASGNASYRLALYRMDLDDEIHFDPATFNNVNLPPTRRYGFELDGRWRVSAGLNAYANYTHAVSRFRSGAYDGNDVPLVPRHSANAGMVWEFMPRTSINAVVHYVGEQAFDGDEAGTFGRRIPSYTLVDLKLSADAKGWLLSAGVRNLFDRHYFTYGFYTGFPTYSAYPAPGRTLFASAQYNYR